MAEKSQIRVEFRPEGVADVVAGMRQIRREAETTAAGVAKSFERGGFVNIFEKPKRDASDFVRQVRGLTGSVGAQLSKGTQTAGFSGDFVNLFERAKPAATGVSALDAALTGILGTARQLVPVLGAAGAVSAVVSLGSSAVQTASDVAKLQQQFRLTAEELTTLRFAARTNEATNEDLERGLQGLAKAQRELRSGNEEVVAAFADLNLKASDFQGLNLAQSFELIAKSIQGIDPTKLNLDAILGRGSRALIPTLNELAEKGLAGVAKEGQRVGAILSDAAVAGAKKLGDESQLVKESVDGLGNSLLQTFGPVIRGAIGGAETLLATLRQLVRLNIRGAIDEQVKGFRGLLRGVGEFIGVVKPVEKPKAPTGGLEEEAARNQVIQATKRQSEEQFKALSELSRQRRELAEQDIEAERLAAETRVAGSRNQIKATQDVQEAEARALQKRVQVATDTARAATDIARARYETELQLARQASTTDAGFAQRRIDVDRQFAAERTKISQAYYADLQRLEAAALAQVKQAREAQKTLDNEVLQNRRRAADIAFEASIGGAGPGSQAIELRRKQEEDLARLKEAAGRGDIERARELRGIIESTATRIAGLDTVARGDGQAALDAANKEFEALSAKIKANAKKSEEDGLKAIASLQAQIAAVQQLITDVSSKPIPLSIGLADSEVQRIVQQIQNALSRPFSITVVPQVQGGGVPGLAEGGRLGGNSPSPKADNLLFAGTAGEFMQPVAAVRHYGIRFMEAVRARRLPRLGDGGQLGDSAATATDIGNGDVVEHVFRRGSRTVRGIFASRDRANELAAMFEEMA